MSSPRILAFAGSTRTESFNKKLVQFASERAREAGGDVTCIDLRDFTMPIYDVTADGKKFVGPRTSPQRLIDRRSNPTIHEVSWIVEPNDDR